MSSRLTCTCSGDPISLCVVLLHLGLNGISLVKVLGSNPKGIVSHVQHLSPRHSDFEDHLCDNILYIGGDVQKYQKIPTYWTPGQVWRSIPRGTRLFISHVSPHVYSSVFKEENVKHASTSVKQGRGGVKARACVAGAAFRSGSLVFMNDVTAERRNRTD